MAVKKKSLKGKKWYAEYKSENRQAKNQARKRAKHAKRHPNDLQSQEKAKPGYKRKKPESPNNTVPKIYAYDGAGRRQDFPTFGATDK